MSVPQDLLANGRIEREISSPPMAYFGGKTRLASRIAAHLPKHDHYVEPFAGSLAVLLAKPRSKHETVNDLDGDLMTFWRVLRDQPDELARACALTPHSRAEHQAAFTDDMAMLPDLERARRVFTRINQGRSGTLRRTGWRYYIDPAGTNKGMPGYLAAYVESRPAAELIEAFGARDVALLDQLVRCRAAVHGQARRPSRSDMCPMTWCWRGKADRRTTRHRLLSGYASEVYEDALTGWDRIEIQTMTGQGGSNQARTEVLWSNRSITEPSLFDCGERDEWLTLARVAHGVEPLRRPEHHGVRHGMSPFASYTMSEAITTHANS